MLDLGDDRLVVDVTPNRGDLLGHKGLARELAASYGIPFRLPAIPGEAPLDLPVPARFSDEAAVGGVRVAIDDADRLRPLARGRDSRRARRPVAGVAARAARGGGRAIDQQRGRRDELHHARTQPADARLRRRHAARAGRHGPDGPGTASALVTLDGVERPVPDGAVVIADHDRVIGLAGVMGGRDTEVTDATTDIFLECAWFDPARVRRARRRCS